jgi:hypothetical protein
MTTPDRITPDEFRAEFNTLRKAIHGLNERIDGLHEEIATLRDGLAQAATAPAAAAQPAGSTAVFDGTILLLSYDDNGEATYKLKGGQYMKFGVRIWPETLPALGIDPTSLKPGPNAVALRVAALLGENGPRKVIGLA